MKSINVFKCKLVKESAVQYEAATDQNKAADLFRAFGIADAAEEIFAIACLATDLSVTGIHEISHGTLDGALVSPREVFKRALLNNAHRIILCHNHPSGNPIPSKEDMDITKKLAEAGKLLGIPVQDHLILTPDPDRSTSFKQSGLL